MVPTTQRILDLINDPDGLEALYRGDPASFQGALTDALHAAPEAAALQVWRARLEYQDSASDARKQRMWHAVWIGLAVGAVVRLPTSWLGMDWYFPRLAPSLMIVSVAAYFWFGDRDRRALVAGLLLTAAAVAYTSFLPDFTDSVVMALLHLPILFWAFLGYVFTGAAWRNHETRSEFVRFNGEALILGSLVGLGIFVFSGITMSLFQMISSGAAEWYVGNVGVVLVAAAPVTATYLYDAVFKRRTGIAPALARVFVPLFLVMATVYLAAAFLGGKNPFFDREFLITVNGLLLVVLGMTVFSIAERGDQPRTRWVDYTNVALIAVTLLIDLIALSAILFRLTSYGFTPNRVVVLGVNLIVMTHLVWTCLAYVGLIRAKRESSEVLQAVVGYLPVYVVWAAVVAFVLPVVFGFD